MYDYCRSVKWSWNSCLLLMPCKKSVNVTSRSWPAPARRLNMRCASASYLRASRLVSSTENIEKWIALNCPFSERTARNYVRVYQRRDILKMANVAVLTDAYGILAKVQAKTANEARDAVKKDKSAEISERLRDGIETPSLLT